MNVLKGTMYITDKEEFIYNADFRTTRIISLDEDGILMDSDKILVGTCLLPPPEAKIAEVDNNERLYDMAYSGHLLEPNQQEFIAALLAYMYQGGNLILFLPEVGYTYTLEKLIQHMWNIYGLHIGIIGHLNPNIANFYCDNRCLPIWMNLIYLTDTMNARAYLYHYPSDAPINNQQVLAKLIDELRPYGLSINEKIASLDHYRIALHKDQTVRQVISSI